jgi:hypothetical protein
MLVTLPEPYHFEKLQWQFFGTLTFTSEGLPERVRRSMWFAFLRAWRGALKSDEARSFWLLRQEEGEQTHRKHFHFLLGGVPPKFVNLRSCFVGMRLWTKQTGAIARIRTFDDGLGGVGYVLKNSGANSYEGGKFLSVEGSRSVCLSHNLRRVIAGGQLVEERRLAQMKKRELRRAVPDRAAVSVA